MKQSQKFWSTLQWLLLLCMLATGTEAAAYDKLPQLKVQLNAALSTVGPDICYLEAGHYDLNKYEEELTEFGSDIPEEMRSCKVIYEYGVDDIFLNSNEYCLSWKSANDYDGIYRREYYSQYECSPTTLYDKDGNAMPSKHWGPCYSKAIEPRRIDPNADLYNFRNGYPLGYGPNDDVVVYVQENMEDLISGLYFLIGFKNLEDIPNYTLYVNGGQNTVIDIYVEFPNEIVLDDTHSHQEWFRVIREDGVEPSWEEWTNTINYFDWLELKKKGDMYYYEFTLVCEPEITPILDADYNYNVTMEEVSPHVYRFYTEMDRYDRAFKNIYLSLRYDKMCGELVDLGLSVKWASANMGAMREYQAGNLYAWGETAAKDTYTWKNYKHGKGTAKTATAIGSDISQTEYDVVFAKDDQLTIPTAEQWQELIDRCTWKTMTSNDGVKGYRVTGPSGASIFLPFTGCSYDGKAVGEGSSAYYWTANNQPSDKSKAKAASVVNGKAPSVATIQRRTGAAIRPVSVESTVVNKFEDLGLPSGTMWATANVGATGPEQAGNLYAWGETATKSTYTWKNYKHGKGTAKTATVIGSDISQTEYDVASGTDEEMAMPTAAQWKELVEQCQWAEETLGGQAGYRVTGPSGASIFLPLTGCSYDGKAVGVGSNAYYWTATNLPSDKSKAQAANVAKGKAPAVTTIQRRTGAAIRPVMAQTDYVDLGLPSGNLWAKCNVGAESPAQPGAFYAWGETATKSNYTWKNYKHSKGTAATVKNIGDDIAVPGYDPSYGNEVTVGSKTYVSRMPSEEDFDELLSACTVASETLDGTAGLRLTGPSGASIFLPFAGCHFDGKVRGKGSYAYYWTSTLNTSNTQKAHSVYIHGATAEPSLCQRRTGAVIRPLYADKAMQAGKGVFDTDGIDSVMAGTPADGAVYTLQGVKVDGLLQPGVYVRNGRKFVVK